MATRDDPTDTSTAAPKPSASELGKIVLRVVHVPVLADREKACTMPLPNRGAPAAMTFPSIARASPYPTSPTPLENGPLVTCHVNRLSDELPVARVVGGVVGRRVGESVGRDVGRTVGRFVGLCVVGVAVGASVKNTKGGVGVVTGSRVGCSVGCGVGCNVVGTAVGSVVGDGVRRVIVGNSVNTGSFACGSVKERVGTLVASEGAGVGV